jgi:hypothetical protein
VLRGAGWTFWKAARRPGFAEDLARALPDDGAAAFREGMADPIEALQGTQVRPVVSR